ncbi:MAG: O-methyltransferase [Clostridia bacterium]|jgi:predicted O-methyltransferase YrrM
MVKRFNIVNASVEKYIEDTLHPLEGQLKVLYDEAVLKCIPVAKIETLRMLGTVMSIKKPGKILELGCAIGLSSMFFAGYLNEGGSIDTVECDLDMAGTAKSNIIKYGYSDKINVVYAEAYDYLSNVNKKYDIIFIDAAKGQYERYFDLCSEMLDRGGIMIADNVLYRGMVAKGDKVPHRQKTLVERLRSFLDRITKDERFDTAILSIGDGLSVSVRK